MSGWWAISFVGLWIVVLLLIAIVFALARQIGVLHMRLGPRGALEIDAEGPPLGLMPPPLVGHDIDGRRHDLTAPGRERLLFFVSPDCPICEQVMPSVPVFTRQGVDVLLITGGDGRAYRRYDVPVIRDDDLSVQLDVPGTPYVIVQDAAGVVRAKGTVNDLEQLEGLLDTARARRHADPHENGMVTP